MSTNGAALRRFKKLTERSGIKGELRANENYEKPCEVRRRKESRRIQAMKNTAGVPRAVKFLPPGPEEMMNPDSDSLELKQRTDRELVLGHRPTARIESRMSPRNNQSQFRLVCAPAPGQRRDLGPWCGSEDRAWQAACLRLGLRLHRRV